MDTRTVRADSPRFAQTLFWLLLLTLAVRVGVLLVMPGALAGAPDGYRRLAENVAEHGTLGEGVQPTAYRPPLYPLLRAPCVALGEGAASTWAIGGLHVLLGVGSVGLVWQLGRRCALGRWAWLAGAMVACDPILLGQSTVVMTETAAAFLVALALLALVGAVETPSWRRAAAAGAALGLCGLCRPELLVWAAACVPAMFILWCRRTREASRDRETVDGAASSPRFSDRSLTVAAGLGSSIAVVLGMLVALLPWAVRNQIQFGRPMVTTTHGGYTLLLANNPSFYEHLREGATGTVWDARGLGPVWGGEAHFDTPAAELAADRRAYVEAWQNIRREPGMFGHSCAVRAGRFWALAPHQGTSPLRWAIGAWYLVEFLLASVGLCVATARLSRHKAVPPCPPCLRGGSSGWWLWGLLLAVSMTAVHAVYWSDMRMRAPLVPVVALAATGGIVSWRGRAQSAQLHADQALRPWPPPPNPP